ncbi:Maf family protein [Heliorestis convoluta]|uniref:dTTP/UTP pyrophosphatase n=1 Tax=Heliorestis convoluta TaxID=356322 RepID=A0A5Q2MX81_9FIRM|nr:Maf family protein [Heliorestis convoluta]QGG47264.1 Maf-like protein [Heliorestis convoluta]
MNLILASASPRRKELLASLKVPFQIFPSDFDESSAEHIAINERAAYLALNKAKTITPRVTEGIVIGADTVVILDDRLLGKPETEADARQMLQVMSSRSHRVVTALALIEVKEGKILSELTGYEETIVFFRELNDEIIEWYLSTGESYDKAGAYGIQGYGSLLVERIEGDYYNVVGLPLLLLERLLGTWNQSLRIQESVR